MTRLYIAGAITNVPDWRERFAEAEERLRAAGYEVVSPVANACSTCGGSGVKALTHVDSKLTWVNPPIRCPDCPSWLQYVKAGIVAMLLCDGVATLEGWKQSDGAGLEVATAMACELQVHGVDAWIAKAAQ